MSQTGRWCFSSKFNGVGGWRGMNLNGTEFQLAGAEQQEEHQQKLMLGVGRR
jgi:hypothetical protein